MDLGCSPQAHSFCCDIASAPPGPAGLSMCTSPLRCCFSLLQLHCWQVKVWTVVAHSPRPTE
ncbi:hypothetical protein LEMLEM_LOCUS20069 [Lemmus lemmus]